MKKRPIVIVVFVLLLMLLGNVIWYKTMRRDVPQPAWITATDRDHFLYGSAGAEQQAGIPYWIWLALPRMFPDYVPGNGGYVALGLSWEEGREMPAGFSKKRVGYVRVAGNCALCHAASYRTGPDEGVEVVLFVPGRATNPQSLLTFYKQCAEDPRFNSAEILTEIGSATKLSLLDKLLYEYYLIPQTRKKLAKQDAVILDLELEDHARDPHSQSAMSRTEMKAFANMIKKIPLPAYPLPTDIALVAAGKQIFAQHCDSCHARNGHQTGAMISIGEVGTDNALQETAQTSGYLAQPLDGLWMRGPYLHNGSVPTVRDLLNVPKLRPSSFYRGNNLIDGNRLGFVSNLEREKGLYFSLYDTTQRGHHNWGHLYGTGLSEQEKDALVEYLKTL